MIVYGDRTRTKTDVVNSFREKYPELPRILQKKVRKFEKQFRELDHVFAQKRAFFG